MDVRLCPLGFCEEEAASEETEETEEAEEEKSSHKI